MVTRAMERVSFPCLEPAGAFLGAVARSLGTSHKYSQIKGAGPLLSVGAADAEAFHGGTVVCPRGAGPQAGRGRGIPRRGNSRNHQGAAAVRRLLCRRL